MKKFCLLFLLMIVRVALSYAQNDTAFFNSEWKDCGRTKAMYYQLVQKKESGYLVKNYFMNGQLQMSAHCSSVTPMIKEGHCIYYDSTGTKVSHGIYSGNKETGIWTSFYNDGKDSVVERYEVDGNKTFVSSSIKPSSTKIPGTFSYVEEMPEFPGGDSKLVKFLRKNMVINEEDKKNNISGRIYVTFVIDKEGNILSPKILRELSAESSLAALQVVKKMPKWKPGMQKGKPVMVQYNLPIMYNIK